MSLQKITCSTCGQEIQIASNKEFCFCLQCGTKILLKIDANKKIHQNVVNVTEEKDNSNADVEKKLEEVAFYYKLSLDKKEYEKFDSEPVYYLKAQDILVDLTQLYPDEYRIWWELCKPIDFENPLSDAAVCDRYSINEDCFNKALDKAELSEKMHLIEMHDKYIEYKNTVKMEAERKNEEAKQRTKLEQQENAKKLAAEKEAGIERSRGLWDELGAKNYTLIDNTYFAFPQENNQSVIGVFKVVSNMLYLMAFRIDGNKSNTVYREQSISIKFDGTGHGMKYDNSLVRVKNIMPPNNVLWISSNVEGRLSVNGMPLKLDEEYITNIMKCAKKPLVSFAKTFL